MRMDGSKEGEDGDFSSFNVIKVERKKKNGSCEEHCINQKACFMILTQNTSQPTK